LQSLGAAVKEAFGADKNSSDQFTHLPKCAHCEILMQIQYGSEIKEVYSSLGPTKLWLWVQGIRKRADHSAYRKQDAIPKTLHMELDASPLPPARHCISPSTLLQPFSVEWQRLSIQHLAQPHAEQA